MEQHRIFFYSADATVQGPCFLQSPTFQKQVSIVDTTLASHEITPEIL